ncbi:MAG TPA: DUF4160 domain-containing protein [Saprospiraceae bacterium]|nr:DUF4160 domain-containing protein [Saprospiraceae bacterium]
MPTYETIKGIKIVCYSPDHLPPHIHAIYNEHVAVIEIETGNIYAGFLPTKQLKLALNYVELNKGDLLETFYSLNERLRKDG